MCQCCHPSPNGCRGSFRAVFDAPPTREQSKGNTKLAGSALSASSLATAVRQLRNQQNPLKPPPPERPFGKQAQAVYEVMKDGKWRSLELITHEAGYRPNSIAAVNARIREFPRRGILYEKRTVGESRVFEYKLTS